MFENRIGVLAGNYIQFKDFLRSADRPQQDYFYISSPECLMGWYGEVIEYGTFWESKTFNSDYYQGFRVLKQIMHPEKDIFQCATNNGWDE